MQTKLQISISAREQLGCCFWDENRRTSGPLPRAPVGAEGGYRVSRAGSWETPFLAGWRFRALDQWLDALGPSLRAGPWLSLPALAQCLAHPVTWLST